MPSLKQIDACLPQTQCTRCGYPRCIDYARAIVEQGEKINRCAPGGQTTLRFLSELSAQPETELAEDVGGFMPRQLASIDEPNCIGCILCIKACPVDAIIGANKLMHVVIHSECTGCELCIPVCPTDCITMQTTHLAENETPGPWPDYPAQFAATARQRNIAHHQRLSPSKTDNRSPAAPSKSIPQPGAKPTSAPNRRSMQADILAAIKRKQKIS